MIKTKVIRTSLKAQISVWIDIESNTNDWLKANLNIKIISTSSVINDNCLYHIILYERT